MRVVDVVVVVGGGGADAGLGDDGIQGFVDGRVQVVCETFSGRHSQEDDDADEDVLAKGQAAQDGHRHFQGEPVGA